MSAGELDALIEAVLPAARVKTQLLVTEAVFGATDLTAAEADALTYAVAFRTGAACLRAWATLPATGTEAPRMTEDAAQVRAQADALDAEAAIFEALAAGTAVPETPGGTAETLRAGTPILVTGTYAPGSLTWRPSDRIGSQDERNDVPAGYRRG